jgi:hypothetical protein
MKEDFCDELGCDRLKLPAFHTWRAREVGWRCTRVGMGQNALASEGAGYGKYWLGLTISDPSWREHGTGSV